RRGSGTPWRSVRRAHARRARRGPEPCRSGVPAVTPAARMLAAEAQLNRQAHAIVAEEAQAVAEAARAVEATRQGPPSPAPTPPTPTPQTTHPLVYAGAAAAATAVGTALVAGLRELFQGKPRPAPPPLPGGALRPAAQETPPPRHRDGTHTPHPGASAWACSTT